MNSLESLSELIGEIYDCSFNPENWTQALTQVSLAFGAAYTAISLTDPRNLSSTGRMAAFSPWDAARLREVGDIYGVQGVPGLAEVVMGDIDEPQSTLSQMSEEEFHQSEFYLNWVAPQGLREACVTKFVQTHDRMGIMAQITPKNRSIISAEDRQFIALLSPHIRRACMISDLLDHQRIAVRSYQTTLSSLTIPIILTNNLGQITYANSAAENLIADGTIITSLSRKLRVVMQQADHALIEAIKRAADGGKTLGLRGIGIPLSLPGKTPAIAYVLPLAGEAERSVFGAATSAIFISLTTAISPPPEAALVTLYDLTPSEARVMCRLGNGVENATIAVQMAISINTLKTHVQRIYQKTNTRKQSEIALLVAGLSSPQQP